MGMLIAARRSARASDLGVRIQELTSHRAAETRSALRPGGFRVSRFGVVWRGLARKSRGVNLSDGARPGLVRELSSLHRVGLAIDLTACDCPRDGLLL